MTNQEKWDRRFLSMAKEVSTWSKDPSTKCGAVLVNDLRQVVGMGYNGFPRGVYDDEDYYKDREKKYPRIVHAELNAILQAGAAARGSTLYVYPSFSIPPICNECAKPAIQAGVVAIVGFTPSIQSYQRGLRWKEKLDLARDMLMEAAFEFREYYE